MGLPAPKGCTPCHYSLACFNSTASGLPHHPHRSNALHCNMDARCLHKKCVHSKLLLTRSVYDRGGAGNAKLAYTHIYNAVVRAVEEVHILDNKGLGCGHVDFLGLYMNS
eukprot:1154045-Pelagomonas_calceolata.AAC.10